MILPILPKLNLPLEGRESIRIARLYAETGILETFTVPMHNYWPGPPAGPLRPENSGIPEPHPAPWATPEDLERLRRTQAIIDKGIQDRIMQAEADQDSIPEPDTERDHLEMGCYFTSATIPPGPFRIGPTTLNDPIKAIQYHLAELKAAPPGSLAARAELNNLRELKATLEAGKLVLK